MLFELGLLTQGDRPVDQLMMELSVRWQALKLVAMEALKLLEAHPEYNPICVLRR